MYYLCTQKDVFRRRKIKRATQPVTPPPPKKHQYWLPLKLMGFPKGSAVKNLPTVQETQVWSLPGSGKSSGGGNGNPLQYSYLKNPMDRGAWRATVQRVTKSWAQPSEHKTQILQVKTLTEDGSSWPPGTLHLSSLLQRALLFSPLPETSFSWHLGLLKWPSSWSGSLDILPWLSLPHSLGLIADLSAHLLFLNVVLLMSQPLTARWGPVSRCTSHPCSLRKGHLRTRCSSRLPTLLDDRRQALWRSCCQWWLQREGAAQFSKPPSPWHSTNRTWFFIYCRHGNLGCLIKMTTWRSSKVAPPWQVPGMYCERLSLSLSRPGNVAWIPRGMVADSLREPSPG